MEFSAEQEPQGLRDNGVQCGASSSRLEGLGRNTRSYENVREYYYYYALRIFSEGGMDMEKSNMRNRVLALFMAALFLCIQPLNITLGREEVRGGQGSELASQESNGAAKERSGVSQSSELAGQESNGVSQSSELVNQGRSGASQSSELAGQGSNGSQDIEYGFGYVDPGIDWEPEKVDFSYGQDVADEDELEVCSDTPAYTTSSSYYRNTNVTSVKYQGGNGLCWAFATIGACEAELIQNNGLSKSTLDLSELHLGYYNFHRAEDPLGNYSAANSDNADVWNSKGSSHLAAMNTLASWQGAVDEAILPYELGAGFVSTREYTAEQLASLGYDYDSYHLENGYIIGKSDSTAIKQAILDYGAIAMSYYHDHSKLATSYGYYRGINDGNTNHEILVVGWDDNFNDWTGLSTTPSDKGAWICRNSWSSSWADSGYFYISYKEPSIGRMLIAFDMESASKYDNIYQYDCNSSGCFYTDGYDESKIVNNRSGVCANVYEAKGNAGGYEILRAVSFISFNSNADYTIKIYKNLTNDSDPTSGTLADTVTGHYTYAGYHTIRTTKDIALSEGSKYSVVVDLKSTSGSQLGVYGVGSDYGFTNDAKAKTSFISSNGNYWTDLSAYNQGVNSIKAFTCDAASVSPTAIAMEKSEVHLSTDDNAVFLKVNISPEEAENASLTWTSSNSSVATVSQSGLVTPVGEGSTTITARTSNGLTTSCLVKVVNAPTAVSGLSWSATTSTATLMWDKVAGASGYNLYVKNAITSQWEKQTSVEQVATDKVTLVLEGLTPGTSYEIGIKSFKKVENQEYESSLVEYGTNINTRVTTKIDKPTNIAVVSKTSSSIKFSWTPVDGAVKYIVSCYGNGTSMEVTEAAVNYTGLEPGKKYSFIFTACGKGNGNNSKGSTANGQFYYTALEKVSDFAAIATSSADITLSWTSIPSVSGYKIINITDNVVYDVDGSADYYFVSDLSAGTNYSFKIKAYSRDSYMNILAESEAYAMASVKTPGDSGSGAGGGSGSGSSGSSAGGSGSSGSGSGGSSSGGSGSGGSGSGGSGGSGSGGSGSGGSGGSGSGGSGGSGSGSGDSGIGSGSGGSGAGGSGSGGSGSGTNLDDDDLVEEDVAELPEVGEKLTDAKDNVYVVTVEGKEVSFVAPKNKKVSSATVPATVKIDDVVYKVTSIEASAFANCTKLKSLEIGSNVTSIGKKAFFSCKNLKNITIKSKNLTLAKVGKKAFYGLPKNYKLKAAKAVISKYKNIIKKRR